MRILFILNDPPYGSERTYNALRLAGALSKAPENEIRVFLMGDAASASKANQKVPAGFYNIELMLHRLTQSKSGVGVCGTCMDARAIADDDLVTGVHRSTLDELAQWVSWANQVLTF